MRWDGGGGQGLQSSCSCTLEACCPAAATYGPRQAPILRAASLCAQLANERNDQANEAAALLIGCGGTTLAAPFACMHVSISQSMTGSAPRSMPDLDMYNLGRPMHGSTALHRASAHTLYSPMLQVLLAHAPAPQSGGSIMHSPSAAAALPAACCAQRARLRAPPAPHAAAPARRPATSAAPPPRPAARPAASASAGQARPGSQQQAMHVAQAESSNKSHSCCLNSVMLHWMLEGRP